MYHSFIKSAVIISAIIILALSIENVTAQYQDISSTNNQIASSSAARSRASFVKDLSGPASGKIQTLDVICGKNFMTVRAEFSGPFYGIVFSKGTYGQENCIYVKPNSGLTHAAFNVYYDQCGTKPDLQGKFYENTIVIQYGSDIIEAYDEAKRLRCEWFEAYEKPATFKPAIPVADLEIVEMNFQGDDIDCWMEIQEGTGPTSREVSKIVPVGQPMTIVVAINDYNGQFDMRVKSCVAHDNVQQPIALTDEYGCVLRPKMLTPFTKVRNPGGNKKATILSYSRFLAFKFPDSMTVQIQCTVEVCRHGCAEACQRVPSIAATTMQPELSLSAKWPAASNQAAIEGPRAPMRRPEPEIQNGDESSQMYTGQPTRVQFSGRQEPAGEEQYGSRPQHYSAPHRQPSGADGGSDDMSGSESSQQSQVSNATASPQVHAYGGRRVVHESNRLNPADGSVPQYLVPINNRRVTYNIRPTTPALAPAPPSTAAPIVVTTTTNPSLPTTMGGESNKRMDNEETAPEVPSDEQLNRLNAPGEQSPAKSDQDQFSELGSASSGGGSNSEQKGDSQAEQTQVKPVVSMPDEQQQPPQQPSENSAASNSQPTAGPVEVNKQNIDPIAEMIGENKPSVQGSDEMVNVETINKEQADSLVASASSPVGQQVSSLKPVEVEIPANEDPVRTLIAGTSEVQSGPFQSTRLSNIDLSQNNGYDAIFESKQQRPQGANNAQYSSPEQVIQPRENPMIAGDKRDRSEEGNFETSNFLATGKGKFGARSQPGSSSAAASSESNQRLSNHQMSSIDSESQPSSSSLLVNRDSTSAIDNDKVLTDRSDDISSVSMDRPSESSQAESAMVAEESSVVGTKVKPVVGTDELPSGPVQIEDRIGAPAPQESLEEAISRLQHQIPQTAALVSGQSQQAADSRDQSIEQPVKLEQRNDAAQQQVSSQPASQSAAVSAKSGAESNSAGVADNRLDASANQRFPGSQQQHQQQQQLQSSPGGHQSKLEPNQPFPNVHGQAKVLPDPMSGLNTRNQMSAQSSNQEPVVQSVSPTQTAQMPAQQQPIGKQPAGIDPSKPVAQITNVPIAIGFPQSQIPAIQQLSQQLAYFQQQQQQQQIKQQQQQTTTAKPTRSRFNLLSPQAALHAVASRILPKSVMQHSAANQQQHQQHIPQMINNLKLTPEQQQRLFAHNQQQYQFNRQQQQQQQQQHLQPPPQYVPSRLIPGQLLPQQQPQQQSQTQGFMPHQVSSTSQPLIRSRRSAIMPNGKRGSGEVGMTKGFLVVTGMDLDFVPNLNETELPQILEGRRPAHEDDDVIYGICMPVVSLTFVLTCAFWLVVFMLCFSIYMLFKAKKLHNNASAATAKSEQFN